MTTASPLLVNCEDVAWFRDQPEAARGAAAALGRRIGLGDQRTAELVLAVTELATNMTKHAKDGSVLLRVLRNQTVAGVEVLAVDSGPGMADVTASLRDGMSTAGTLGIGLGAVRRLADSFDIHSQPGTGTVQLARFWPRPVHPSVAGEPVVGGVTRPISGEQICGDAWAVRTDTGTPEPTSHEETPRPHKLSPTAPDWATLTGTRSSFERTRRNPSSTDLPAWSGTLNGSIPVRAAIPGVGQGVLVMSCDGLGHGPMAAVAAQAAVHAFRTASASTPEQAMEQVHRALRGTRGAAVAVARLEPDGRVLFCGVGNISAALVTPAARTSLLSHPGIVGYQMRQLRTYEHHLPAHGILVMHSDGLSERWKAADLAGLLHHPPAVIATGLLRHAGTRRDDASAVIAKAAW
ncbi:ATP-binding SpoIIE family protein phosphatase [Streptomyces bauhiniae]|uniref:SpoIIE family protein phosphatase n=1 Tax=Streptomyces bauhiniae TaxID=2340725 RepID=A0A7K3QM30_9ACTN|nr:ATP-binding SpoIIE family protein phosphatase [Streptomyces bauhiniae]NEB90957.1 SpoIIE family protein phosphatase [Streptomyces bauhiniae]